MQITMENGSEIRELIPWVSEILENARETKKIGSDRNPGTPSSDFGEFEFGAERNSGKTERKMSYE